MATIQKEPYFDFGEIYDICILGNRFDSLPQKIRLNGIVKTMIRNMPNPVVSSILSSGVGIETIQYLSTITDMNYRPKIYIPEEKVVPYDKDDTSRYSLQCQIAFIRDMNSIHHLLSTSYCIVSPWPNICKYDMGIISRACEDTSIISHRFIFVSSFGAVIFRPSNCLAKQKRIIDINALMRQISLKFAQMFFEGA